MGMGLQIFGANGGLLLDVSDRLCRYLGEFMIGPNAGSFNIQVGKGRRIWFYVNKNTRYDWGDELIGVTLSGNTIMWEKQEHDFFSVVYGDC